MSTLDKLRLRPPSGDEPAPALRPAPASDTDLLSDALVTPVFRLVAVLVVVDLFLVGQLATGLGYRLPGELATSAFLQAGPGVVLCAFLPRLPRHVFVLLSVVGGAALVTVLASVSALTGAFGLPVVWPAVVVATLLGAVAAGVRDGLALHRQTVAAAAEPAPWDEPVPARWDEADRARWDEPVPVHWDDADPAAPAPATAWRPLLLRLLPVLLSLGGAALALAAAAAHRGVPRPDGAAVTAGPWWFAGALAVLAGLGVAWRRRTALTVPVLTLSTVVVASQALMYREPTAVVAARHIGLVDYILERGVLDRSTDIYQAWAGLFASAALNVRAAGISDLFGYATWWGVVAAPLMVLAVRSLAGRFVGPRRAWLAALLFGLGSSLNTSFFAPQVFGFLMAITVVALLVRPAGQPSLLPTPVVVPVVLVLSVAMTLSHQISPYMLTLALVTLAVFGLVRPRWAFVLAAVPAVAWALLNKHLLTSYVSVSAIGKLVDNLAPPEHSVGTFPVPLANRFAFELPAAALVVIGLLALLTLLRRRDRTAWALALTSASPVALMAGTSYGQEGIFRVALFALPWLAVLASLPHTRPARLRLPHPAVAGAVALALLFAVNVTGLTGMDWARVIRSGDVGAARWVEGKAPAGSLVLTLGTDLTMPVDSTARYTDVVWVSRTNLIPAPAVAYPTTSGDAYDADADLAAITRRFAKLPATEHYAVAAASTGAYDQRYGNQRYSDHQKLVEAIARSSRWREVHVEPGAVVYELRT